MEKRTDAVQTHFEDIYYWIQQCGGAIYKRIRALELSLPPYHWEPAISHSCCPECTSRDNADHSCALLHMCIKVTSLRGKWGGKKPWNMKWAMLSLSALQVCVYAYFGLIVKLSGLQVQVLPAIIWKNSSWWQKYLPEETFICNEVSLNRCWQTEIAKKKARPITFHESVIYLSSITLEMSHTKKPLSNDEKRIYENL